MEDKKDFTIKIEDHYSDCLQDGMSNKNRPSVDKRPKGFVEIYEIENGEKKLVGKPNLVVYQGREWLIARAFNYTNPNMPDLSPNEFLCWFGVGNGGTPVGDPMDPTSPTNLDIELSNPVMINASDPLDGDYRVAPYDEGFYKHPFDQLVFEQDVNNYNHYLIIEVTTTLGADDANGYNINEAGLYTAEDGGGGSTGPFHLYARVTFPSITKTSARQLMFVWYVFF